MKKINILLGLLLFSSVLPALSADLVVGDTHQSVITYDDVSAKTHMNDRLMAGDNSAGDIKPTGVYQDATGRAASSSTSTVQVNKVASIGGGCARGQLSTDSNGKLLSCESGRWESTGGVLPDSLDARIKTIGVYTENGFNAPYANCNFYANGDGSVRVGGYSGRVVGNVLGGGYYAPVSEETCEFFPDGHVEWNDNFVG